MCKLILILIYVKFSVVLHIDICLREHTLTTLLFCVIQGEGDVQELGESTGHLTIHKVTRAKAGPYECTVNNGIMPPASVVGQLVVLCEFYKHIIIWLYCSKLIHFFNPTCSLRILTVYVYDAMRVLCLYHDLDSACAPQENSWTKFDSDSTNVNQTCSRTNMHNIS